MFFPLFICISLLLFPTFAFSDIHPSTIDAISHPATSNTYIVIFQDHVSPKSRDTHHRWLEATISTYNVRENNRQSAGQVSLGFNNLQASGLKHTYDINSQLFGYSGYFDDGIIEEIRRNPDVAWVEQDSEVQIQSHDGPIVQNNAPWGLARISQRDKLQVQYGNTYLYSEEAGAGVNVYIIDTGININHIDFESRAFVGKTIVPNDEDEDGHGHGTHCSGVIVGKQFGVAKKAEIYSVKTVSSNGRGKQSDIIKALEWIINAHKKNLEADQNSKSPNTYKGSVINISLGGPRSVASNMAVDAAVDAGIHIAVAAGNDNGDACHHSPSSSQMAITVGASTISDERAWFSNHGKCNDVFAPGFDIPGPWIGSNKAVRSTSGTSTASPHVAGLLAYFLSLQPSQGGSAYAVPPLTTRKLKELVIGVATKNALANVPTGTSNVLIWNAGGSLNISKLLF